MTTRPPPRPPAGRARQPKNPGAGANADIDKLPSYKPAEKWHLFCQLAYTLFSVSAIGFLAFASKSCAVVRIPSQRENNVVLMEVTAYDNGQKSCNWKYDAKGKPVIATGPDAGKPKTVGLTASGKMTAHGTIAADTKYYPFGTVMHIPGYGTGTVLDRGGAIKGPHRIDLWFPSEKEALKWGRQKNVPVTVRKPDK